MNLLIILCLLTCNGSFVLSLNPEFVPLAFNRVVKEGSSCSVTADETGKCVSSSRCSLPNHEKLKKICEWKELSPVVCCPKKDEIKEFIPLAFDKVLEEGSECGGSSGAEGGECVSSLRCQLPNEEKLKRICKWNGATPVVCCPKNMQIEGKFKLPDCSFLQEENLCSKLLFCREDRQYQQGGFLYNCSVDLTFCELCCAGSTYDLNRSPPSVEVFQEEGSPCDISSNVRGTCELLMNCNLNSTEGIINICGWARDMPLVCCPQLVIDLLAYGEKEDFKGNDLSITNPFELPDCSKNGNSKSCLAVSFCELRQQYQHGDNLYSCSERDNQYYKRQLCCEEEKRDQASVLSTIHSLQDEGTYCVTPYNGTGTCEVVNKCFVYVDEVLNICGRNSNNELTVCCPGFFGFPDCSTSKKEKSCRRFLLCNANEQYSFGGNLYSCSFDSSKWRSEMCCVENGRYPNHSREMALQQSFQEDGSVCKVDVNVRGTCESQHVCNEYPGGTPLNVCGKGSYSNPSICCPEHEKIKCGEQRSTHDWDHTQLYGRSGIYPGEYVLNRTSDILLSLNYSLQVTNMHGDEIAELHAKKGSKKFLYKKFNPTRVAPVGGVPAAVERAQYMASLGAKVAGGGIEWLCDGVVISTLWVMSAAHCFVGSDLTPDFIRLGVYEKEKSFYEPYPDYDGIEDFGISEVVYYPDFVNPQRYHDIVLIRLSRPIPNENSKIEPICLPWWPENKTTEGQQLTLSGWGATKFLGDKINVLHEVNLTVFHTAVCDASYSTLSDFDTKWPEGMDPERILCVGSAEGGKDACQGDSGGPLVYTDKRGLFTLAGIVSAGYGCGLQEFPGIYIPITAPEYIEWIRKIAY